MNLVPINTSSASLLSVADREMAVSSYLEQARDWLATAVEKTGPEEIANAKAQIATAAEATKQLGLSKEIQLDAQEMVRRAEYALSKAIRQGQDEGTISKPHLSRPFRGLDVDHPDIKRMSDLVGKSEWNGGGNGHAGINTLADVEPEDFEVALAEAKEEGNASRANVVRKIRDKKAPAAPSRADRANHIRDLADRGYSSRQIAEEVGIHFDTVRNIVRDFDIDVPADAAIGRTRRLDHTQMVESTVTDLVNTTEFIEAHIDLSQVDFTEADEWVSSLTDSIRALNRFIKQIKEKTHV